MTSSKPQPSSWLDRLLSGDRPRSLPASLLLCMILVLLVATPFVFPGAKSLSVAAKIAIFIVLVASYDLLLGYTGIVSFAHTMFFGIGAYGCAIASTRMGASWSALLVGTAVALLLSGILALVIGLFSLRVRAIFFAMITLAVATAFQTLASQLSEWTGGEDGLTFKLPEVLQPSFVWLDESVLGIAIDGRILSFYLVLGTAAILFLLLLRIVNSPFGRVLQAIRENPFRADALGFPTVLYRTVSNLLAALFATLAGVLLAIWLRYNGPDTSLSFEIMLDILLMVVIGGMGTLYGAIIGATVFLLAQSYLQDMLKLASSGLEAIPLAAALFSPDRWLLWLGVLFVLSVYHFPSGILGRLRIMSARKTGKGS
jgi:branched-chain amino acid transport system permease protein